MFENRPLAPARSARQTRIEWTLRQLIREGRIGTPTHVSCIDRRSDPARADGAANLDYAQVLALGADDLNRLRNILGRDPVRMLARCTRAAWSTYRHGSTTEAFVEMTGGLHIHYYGSLTSNRSEHALRLEGDRGVLWTDRSLIWWRKRGWPVFVPIRSRSVPAGGKSAKPDDEPWTLAIVEAAIRSDRTRTTVDVSDVFQTAGADPGVTLSGRNVT